MGEQEHNTSSGWIVRQSLGSEARIKIKGRDREINWFAVLNVMTTKYFKSSTLCNETDSLNILVLL